ncbi:MAG: hypothetical protein ABR991_04520 [Terracidiphilus sp.]
MQSLTFACPTKQLAMLVLMLCAFRIHAEDTVVSAIERLLKVDVFAFGGIGIAGQTSKGEIDFRVILSQPAPVALQALEKLYKTGNPQGKAYALFGIRKLNPSRFKEILVSASKSAEKVAVMSGCIVMNESLSDIAKRIDNGKFDLFFEYSSANTTKPRSQKP